MDIVSKDVDSATVRLSRDELYMLALAVHTVCDGMAVMNTEFATIMGGIRACTWR